MVERMTNKVVEARESVRSDGLPTIGASLVSEMRSLVADKRNGAQRSDYLVITGRLSAMERMLKRDDLNKDPDFERSFAQMMRKASSGKEENTSDRFRGALLGLTDRASDRYAKLEGKRPAAVARD